MPEATNTRRFLSPPTLPAPIGYSHVVEVSGGRLVYVSGQVPLDRDGELVGGGDFAAQTRQVFDNLTAALAAANASWADVVKLNYFLTDVSRIGLVRAIRDEYVNTEQPPASTLVEVSGLFRDDILIEIDAVAIVD
jgi:reactive intermediate/imine deaminase